MWHGAAVRVVGVDGCRGRWLAAVVTDTTVEWQLCDDLSDALAGADMVGIDMPIGLPDSGARACDIAARVRVGPRRSSVFPAPPRAVLEAASYAEARALLVARGAASMSAQAFGIVRAIRAVDALMTPERERQVIETHPEVSFAVMAGRHLAPKKTAAGVAQRIAALRTWRDPVPIIAVAPDGVPVDDALDALACAWSALRFATGRAEVLGDGQRDARGLVMRIIV